MALIVGSSPVLMVKDVLAAARYYGECAGFGRQMFFGEPVGFCICERDGFRLMLAQVDAGKEVTPFWMLKEKTCGAYFWVEDADGLYAELKGKGARMDYGPCTQPYGVREFGIQDLDGNDVSFGQAL